MLRWEVIPRFSLSIGSWGISLGMIDPSPLNPLDHSASSTPFIAIAVGNTRTRVGVLKGKECVKAQSIATSSPAEIAQFASALFEEFDFPANDPVVLMSSVADEAADAIEEKLTSAQQWTVYRIGRDVQIPIQHTLSESGEETVGQDRLLCAIGAFGIVKQACIVVDMGTAITVDFVDGEGVFHGGAILPGVNMMLESLSESTAHLPAIKYTKPSTPGNEPAKQTDEAMLLGVYAAVSGSIRFLAERYAQFYEGYPQVLATGGDIGVLEDDELIEAFVPDLQLQGIRATCEKLLSHDDHELDR